MMAGAAEVSVHCDAASPTEILAAWEREVPKDSQDRRHRSEHTPARVVTVSVHPRWLE